mgnify:FL=1
MWDRELCPKHPDGSFDFECLESIDVKLFNEDMNRLLKGEAVDMLPSISRQERESTAEES